MRKMLMEIFLCSLVSTVLASNILEDTRIDDYQVQSIEEDAYGKVITVSISEPSWANVGPDNRFRIAEYPGEGFYNTLGQPLVPVFGRIVRMPLSGGAHIEILDSHFSVLNNVDYAAFWGDGLPEELVELDTSVDMWYPEEVVNVGDPAILKDFRVANVSTCPIQVNPARRQVRVYDRLQYRIAYDQSTDENGLDTWPTMLSETFLPFYRQMLDWNETELDQYELYRGSVQLVCQEAFLNLMHDWIIWKKQKGWDVQIITDADVAWNNDAIKSELQSRYDASDTKFDHIVIVGDASGAIWTPHGSPGDYYGAGDHEYGLLAGDDQIMEASVGRISVSSESQLSVYVQKVLFYEKYTNTEDIQWYKSGSVAAGSISMGRSTVYVGEYTKKAMLDAGYTQVSSAYFNDGRGSVYSRMYGQLNSGVGFHLYLGDLGSGLTNSAIRNLNNVNKTPVVLDITCGRGNWADELSISEGFIRAGSENSPTGAIGAVSTATSSTDTKYINTLSGGAVDAVFVKKTPTLGQMLIGAKYNMWQNLSGFQNNNIDEFNQWFHLMGDPTVWIYTDVPDSTITISIDSEINVGHCGMEIVVQDGNGALKDAWVTFYKSDELEEVIAKGVTDGSGSVFLDTYCEYPGNAIVTVTAYNYLPEQQNVSVVASENMISITGCDLIDDGSQGTSGNGNGIVEAGETVGLLFSVSNLGDTTETSIELSAQSSDENINSITGSSTLATLAAGEELTFTTPIFVEIDPNAPNDWLAILEISIDGSSADYLDNYRMKISAPDLVFMESSGVVLPGQEGTVTFTIANIGDSDIGNTTLSLQVNDINSDWITINNAEGTLAPVLSGASTVSSEFSLTGNPMAFKGYVATGLLTIENSAQRIQEVPVRIQMGIKTQTDPEGPDGYGYFAYDDVDVSYIMNPHYEWIEIDPDEPDVMYEGIEPRLHDWEEDYDASIAIDLPFAFTYYGETYTTITICSNGWIAMGDQEGMALYRNWIIPSPLGPSAMIAPFWDDRTNDIRYYDGSIFYYHQADEGKFIIEWNKTLDVEYNGLCSFQVVLLESSEDFPTPTGDNEFLFYYKEINPTVGVPGDVPYWTTGIENASQDDGLQLYFNNIPSSGTAPITEGRSILITTRKEFPSGEVNGTVTLLGENSAIEGVLVTTTGIGTWDLTDSDGHYSILTTPGMVDIIFRHDDYQTITIEDVMVPEDGSVTVDTQMSMPAISIDPESLTVNLEPDDFSIQSLIIENPGSGILSYNIDIHGSDPAENRGNIGTYYSDFQLPEIQGVSYMDCASSGDTIWMLTTTPDEIDMNLRLYNLEGNLLNIYRIPSSNDLEKLKVYGDIIVCGVERELRFYTRHYQDLVLDSTKTMPRTEMFYDFAIDYQNEKIYICYSDIIREYDFNMQSEVGYSFNAFLYFGIEVLPDDPDGYNLHMMASTLDAPYFTNYLIRYSTEDHSWESITDRLGYYSDGYTIINIDNGVNSVVGLFFEHFYGSPIIGLVNYFSDLDWITLDNTSGSVQPGGSETINVGMNSVGKTEGVYNAWLSIDHNVDDSMVVIPMVMNVNTVGIEEETKIPQEWVLDKIYPNPFNPVATVKFSLLENVAVNARLYNVLGQQVAELVNRPMQAGQHTLTINGENLSSGVYFLKFNAGPLSSVQKVVLLK